MEFLKIWTDFREVIAPLEDDEKGKLFDAMLLYAETGEEPNNLYGNERFIWPVAKRDIDRMNSKCEANRANGSKGGRPKTEANPTKPNETENNRTEPNESLKEKKDKEKESNVKETLLTESKEKRTRFSPPSVEEVRAYCQERNNGIDPEAFVAFYASKGWKVGNSPMKDWKQCVITWEKRDGKTAPQRPTKTVVAQQYGQRDYSGVQDELMAEQDDYISRRIAEKKAQEDAEMEEWLRRESS